MFCFISHINPVFALTMHMIQFDSILYSAATSTKFLEQTFHQMDMCQDHVQLWSLVQSKDWLVWN